MTNKRLRRRRQQKRSQLLRSQRRRMEVHRCRDTRAIASTIASADARPGGPDLSPF